MDGVKEDNVKQSYPIPKNQMPNVFFDIRKLVHSGVGRGNMRGTDKL